MEATWSEIQALYAAEDAGEVTAEIALEPGLRLQAERPDGATIEKMIADYNASVGQEQDATVNLLIVPWDQYYTKLTVALASRQAPMPTWSWPGFRMLPRWRAEPMKFACI